MIHDDVAAASVNHVADCARLTTTCAISMSCLQRNRDGGAAASEIDACDALQVVVLRFDVIRAERKWWEWKLPRALVVTLREIISGRAHSSARRLGLLYSLPFR